MDDHVLDGVDVVGDARHDIAAAPRLEEAQRLAQEVPVGVQAHVEDEALAQPVHHVHPHRAEEVIEQIDREQHPAEPRERPEIAGGDDLVEDLPQDLRGVEARGGHHEHAEEPQRQSRPVRAEVAREPRKHPPIGYAQRLDVLLEAIRFPMMATAAASSSSVQHLRVTPTCEDDHRGGEQPP